MGIRLSRVTQNFSMRICWKRTFSKSSTPTREWILLISQENYRWSKESLKENYQKCNLHIIQDFRQESVRNSWSVQRMPDSLPWTKEGQAVWKINRLYWKSTSSSSQTQPSQLHSQEDHVILLPACLNILSDKLIYNHFSMEKDSGLFFLLSLLIVIPWDPLLPLITTSCSLTSSSPPWVVPMTTIDPGY